MRRGRGGKVIALIVMKVIINLIENGIEEKDQERRWKNEVIGKKQKGTAVWIEKNQKEVVNCMVIEVMPREPPEMIGEKLVEIKEAIGIVGGEEVGVGLGLEAIETEGEVGAGAGVRLGNLEEVDLEVK